MKRTPKIKPCPFCGQSAIKSIRTKQWLIDHNLACWIGKGRTQLFKSNEIPFWNRRSK